MYNNINNYKTPKESEYTSNQLSILSLRKVFWKYAFVAVFLKHSHAPTLFFIFWIFIRHYVNNSTLFKGQFVFIFSLV